MSRFTYPFSAIVGQEELKLGLLLNAVNPAVGGLLVRGEKGTAKSTLVRGLAAILPEIEVVAGCPCGCDPDDAGELCPDCHDLIERELALPRRRRRTRFVTLPLNATEDRVAGGIDFSATLKSGRVKFQPGLLAAAHRGILYIDEVNLLDDHLVDLVLDAAASGRNHIEREGLSHSHPARFILVGTMNPEEGELRPQFLDRFGLCVGITSLTEPDERVELMLRREAFDRNPQSFVREYEEADRRLARKIVTARQKLPWLRMPNHLRGFIAEICRTRNVAGHRADLVLEQAARALAALEGENEIATRHLERVLELVLVHRQRETEPPPPPAPEASAPESPDSPEPEPPVENENQKDESREDETGSGDQLSDPGEPDREENRKGETATANADAGKERGQPGESTEPEANENESPAENPALPETVFGIGTPFRVKDLASARDRIRRRGSGRRSRSLVSQRRGRCNRAGRHGNPGDLAFAATIRAAAAQQPSRRRTGGNNGLKIRLEESDFHYNIREKRVGNLLLFLVDASGSMGARGRMAASKGAVMSLLLDAYQKRDRVGLISFRRDRAVVNLPPTNSIELAGRLLAELPTGGRTPLNSGLLKTYEQVRNHLVREPAGRPIVIILTDGRGNVSLGSDRPLAEMDKIATALAHEERVRHIVIDTEEEGPVTFDLARRLAAGLKADYFKIRELKADELVGIVNRYT